jgi:ketosteroid isomerase-like protein
MITKEFAEHFAQDWIEAWNSHDLDRILAHYSDDFEMTSPFIVTMMSVPSGTLQGKESIRKYWARGLERRPNLAFELQKITFGVNTVALHCRSELERNFVEWFFFADEDKVVKSLAHHDEILLQE